MAAVTSYQFGKEKEGGGGGGIRLLRGRENIPQLPSFVGTSPLPDSQAFAFSLHSLS